MSRPGAELIVEGNLDLQADDSALENHGTIRVRGILNVKGPADIIITLGRDRVMILEGGTVGSRGGALLIQEAGHTITVCSTLSANIDNHGVIDVNCPSYSSRAGCPATSILTHLGDTQFYAPSLQ